MADTPAPTPRLTHAATARARNAAAAANDETADSDSGDVSDAPESDPLQRSIEAGTPTPTSRRGVQQRRARARDLVIHGITIASAADLAASQAAAAIGRV